MGLGYVLQVKKIGFSKGLDVEIERKGEMKGKFQLFWVIWRNGGIIC